MSLVLFSGADEAAVDFVLYVIKIIMKYEK